MTTLGAELARGWLWPEFVPVPEPRRRTRIESSSAGSGSSAIPIWKLLPGEMSHDLCGIFCVICLYFFGGFAFNTAHVVGIFCETGLRKKDSSVTVWRPTLRETRRDAVWSPATLGHSRRASTGQTRPTPPAVHTSRVRSGDEGRNGGDGSSVIATAAGHGRAGAPQQRKLGGRGNPRGIASEARRAG